MSEYHPHSSTYSKPTQGTPEPSSLFGNPKSPTNNDPDIIPETPFKPTNYKPASVEDEPNSLDQLQSPDSILIHFPSNSPSPTQLQVPGYEGTHDIDEGFAQPYIPANRQRGSSTPLFVDEDAGADATGGSAARERYTGRRPLASLELETPSPNADATNTPTPLTSRHLPPSPSPLGARQNRLQSQDQSQPRTQSPNSNTISSPSTTQSTSRTPKINIKITDSQANELLFHVKPTTKLGMMMELYCEEFGKAYRMTRFYFEGERALPSATVGEMDMVDGDTLDACQEQIGGAGRCSG